MTGDDNMEMGHCSNTEIHREIYPDLLVSTYKSLTDSFGWTDAG